MIYFPHKILVPQRPPYLVPRPRLTDLLQSITDRRLITLSAPAGYGKTSLLTDFASTAPPLPLCWYTLDRFDADPWVFLGYLAAAIEQRFPGAMEETSTLLASRSRNPFATAAAALVRNVYGIGREFAVVIDDWHLVDHVADITETVTQLLLHCPNCHLILASRIYPSLPDMMLLAARRQMSGLDEEHLRFTAPEISSVLSAEYRTAISPEQARALAEQSNGWITGILLATQVTGPTAPALATGDIRAERQIYRFLAEQVFDRQPPEIRAFLLDSALLEDLTPESCDAVFERSDSGQRLQTLLRHHLFITEIKPGVFRYHPLFREFLQEHYRTIDPQRYHCMALRVAGAYMAQGQWSLAFDIYIAVGDRVAAQRVVATGGEQLYMSGRLETMERWFGVLALDDLDAPLLCLKARVLLERGRVHEAQALAGLAEARMQSGDEVVVLLLQAQIARVVGRYEQALEIAQHVLQIAQDVGQRTWALRTMAICHHRLGHPKRALAGLNEALVIASQRGDLYAIAQLQHDLGVCHEETGQLHQAAEYYSHADAYWAMSGNMGLRSMSLNCKGVVQHLMGHYRDAYATLTAALDHARDASMPTYQATALASLGDLYSDLQLWIQAGKAYDEARLAGGSGYLMSYLDLAVVRLMIRQRQFESAMYALERLPDMTVSRHPVTMRLLTGSCACGFGNHDEALRDLQLAIRELKQTNKPMDLARAYLLQAQVAAESTPAESGLLIASLDCATQIADQLGHDAFLVAETLHMGNVLRRAQATGWRRAADWLQRQHDMRLVAQSLQHDSAQHLLVVRTLGLDQILLDGQPLELGWLKAREVFYYLLAHPEGATPDAISEAIWPDLGRDNSRNTLKTAIYQLRCALPRELITLRGRQQYVLNRDVAQIDYDVERFLTVLDTHTGDLEVLFEVLDLYRGQYLPWSDNEWSNSLRLHLEQRYRYVLRVSAECCEQADGYLDALNLYQRLLAVDSLDEAAHAGVMRCQIALGNRAAAIGQYQVLRRKLDEELGLELGDGSEVERLYYRILAAS